MDISKFRKQVQEAQEASSNLLFIAEKGENTIRLVPNKYKPDLQYIMAWVHYKQGGVVRQTTFSPKTFGAPDPIEEFVNEELKVNVPKDVYVSLMNLMPKPVYLTPVIVKKVDGEEVKPESVKWLVLSGGRASNSAFDLDGQFGRLYAEAEKAFKKRPDHDYTDVKTGNDLNIIVTPKEKSTKNIKELDYDFDRDDSPMLEDSKMVAKLLENIPNWENIFPKMTYDELKKSFDNYMRVQASEEGVDEQKKLSVAGSKSVAKTEEFNADDVLKQADKYFGEETTPAPQETASKASVKEVEADPDILEGDDDDDLPF